MPDTCTFTLFIHKKDLVRVNKLLGWNLSLDNIAASSPFVHVMRKLCGNTTNPDALMAVDEEAVSGNTIQVETLVAKKLTFWGYHSSGLDYPGFMFACYRGDFCECATMNDGTFPAAEIGPDLMIHEKVLSDIAHFYELMKLIELSNFDECKPIPLTKHEKQLITRHHKRMQEMREKKRSVPAT